jgi:hypothetical protein
MRGAGERKYASAGGSRAIGLSRKPGLIRVYIGKAKIRIRRQSRWLHAYTLWEYEKMFRTIGFRKTTVHQFPDMPQQVLVSEKAE